MASLGIETGDPELFAQHRQNADLDMLAEKIRMIKAAGIRAKGLLMMGLPGESRGVIRRSMDYVFSLPIDDFNLAKFTPFPGSPLYETIHDLGSFDEDWEQMDCMQFHFVPQGMDTERLEELLPQFYKRHFQRPAGAARLRRACCGARPTAGGASSSISATSCASPRSNRRHGRRSAHG